MPDPATQGDLLMNKAELQLITEIRKQFSLSLNESVEDLSFVIIEPRVPEDKEQRSYETYINVYGTLESGSKGWAGTQKKWVSGQREACQMCGGAKKVKLNKAVMARIDYFKDRIEFMKGEIAKGKMSQTAVRDRENRIKAYENDIDFFIDMAERLKDVDEEIICPVCSGMEWIDVEDYKDPKTKKKAKTPWKKVMTWLWDTLEAANLSPIQGAVDPTEAGFDGPDDKYGLEIASKDSDIKRSIKIATKSLGTNNRRVFENLAQVLYKASDTLKPFNLERWPAKGVEDKAREEQSGRKGFDEWVEENRAFYVTGRVETPGAAEDIGLEPFDILPPHNYACKNCGIVTMLPSSYSGHVVECPRCGNANRTMEEPVRSGAVDMYTLMQVLSGEVKPGQDKKDDDESKKFPIPLSTPQRSDEWQDIIRHIKGYSAQRRSERSEKAAETYKQTPEYYEKFVKPKKEKKKLERSRREWAGPKYEYWDKFVGELADDAGIDSVDMEVAVGKYMDSLGSFEKPFDFDRLNIDDAIKALNIIKIIDADDIEQLAKEAKEYNDNMLREGTDNSAIDYVASSLVIDLGSDEANRLYWTISKLNDKLFIDDPIYRESAEFNNTYRIAEGKFNVLLEKSMPTTKLLKIVPTPSSLFDPSSVQCWANIINGILIEDYPASTVINANKTRMTFKEGMQMQAPWAWEFLSKMSTAAIRENSNEISRSIGIIWDALISGRPVIADKYEQVKLIASNCGAEGLFDASV